MTRLLLLPGLDGTSALFEPFIRHAPSSVHVQTLEYDRVDATSYEMLADFVAPQLPHEDFFIVAWSFSGPLALKLASRGISGLRGIVLVASFAWRPVRCVPAWLTALPGIFSFYPMASMAQALLYGYSTPELRVLQSAAFSKTSARALATRARMVLEVDAKNELRSCPVPLLYLRAERDRVIHGRHGTMIVEQAPRATLVDIPGPHLCLATHPRDAWAAIEPFIGISPRPEITSGPAPGFQ